MLGGGRHSAGPPQPSAEWTLSPYAMAEMGDQPSLWCFPCGNGTTLFTRTFASARDMVRVSAAAASRLLLADAPVGDDLIQQRPKDDVALECLREAPLDMNVPPSAAALAGSMVGRAGHAHCISRTVPGTVWFHYKDHSCSAGSI